jgi:hypothetical protein
MWEPIENTGERVAALLCVEPTEFEERLAPRAYSLLGVERLRGLLGRHRGEAAASGIAECAQYMTERMTRGVPIEHVEPLFHSFIAGPVQIARAYSVEQLVDAAVRTLTIFGSAAEVFLPDEEASRDGVTRRTSAFIRQLRRTFAGGDDDLQRRFHVKLQREQSAPAVYVDYANGPVVMQVASVPASPNQAPPAEAELKAKILDLEVVRREFDGNQIEPLLMLNVHSLREPLDEDVLKISTSAHDQIRRYADWAKLRVIEVSSASEAAKELEAL